MDSTRMLPFPPEQDKLASYQAMKIVGFFVLLGIAIGVHVLLKRYLPLAVPKGRLKVVAAGWLGGVAASLLEGLLGPWEPELLGSHLLAAVAGSTVSIAGWGITPFVGILLGMKRRRLGRPTARTDSR
ncbi:MAG: hypothetical protein HY671_15285 [Chloroflexi bacterium]|nr:hypothetical protein [Chloroflexota bacterium]